MAPARDADGQRESCAAPDPACSGKWIIPRVRSGRRPDPAPEPARKAGAPYVNPGGQMAFAPVLTVSTIATRVSTQSTIRQGYPQADDYKHLIYNTKIKATLRFSPQAKDHPPDTQPRV